MSSKSQLEDLKRLEFLMRYSWRCLAPDDEGVCPTDGKPHAGHPFKHARKAQLPPIDRDFYVWLLLSGRGFGKTRAGAEFVKERMLENANHRVAIIAPDAATGRDICVEGESGLRGLSEDQGVIPWDRIKTWNRSLGELVLTNGSVAKLFGTDSEADAEKLRGYQCGTLWFEELGTQNHGDVAWDMAEFALRLGDDPKIVVTTTPRPIPIIKRLLEDPDTYVTRGTTFDNASNLPERTLSRLRARYEGTTLGRQELQGEVLTLADGALWSPELIVRCPVPEDMSKIVVSIDPAGSHKPTSDETGIVVVGYVPETPAVGGEIEYRPSRAYVLADHTGRYTPEQWSSLAVSLYHQYEAAAIVAETNYGGALVTSTIRSADPNVRIKDVKARVGKALRAEPVVGLYEQGRVLHCGELDELEDELLSWVPPGRFDAEGNPLKPTKESPNRLDALVWAIYALSLAPQKKRGRLQFIR